VRINRPIERKRLEYITAAYIAALLFGAFFNLILPWFGNYELIWIGPISVVIFATVIQMAIMRYRLFNIRLLAAKSVLWVAIGVVMGVTCSLLLSITHNNEDNVQSILPKTIILVALFFVFYAFTQYLINSAERTFKSRLLDSDLLNQISEKVLHHVELDNLLDDITKTIASHLRDGFAVVSISSRKDTYKEIGTAHLGFKSDELGMIRDYLNERSEISIITEETNSASAIYDFLSRKNISAVIRLDVGDYKKIESFFILGSLKTNVYSEREVKALIAISGVLSMAIENIFHYKEIQDFNEELKIRIAQATANMRASNRKLRKFDAVKDDFLSMASHQLRTPLTSIKGYLSMLLDNDFGKLTGEQRRVLSEVYISSDRMAFIIGDFLDVSRLQTGKFELQKVPTNLDEILNTEIDQLKVTANAREIKLIYQPPVDLPVINCDQNELRQVMMNMIDNAIFYSHSGAKIEVNLYRQGQRLVFTVRDHGIGVPKTEQHKLFEKFYRASNARQARPDGTGVGLYIARKIIIAHGGSLIFESQENVGSTFGFRLPIR
jgi:signal transduction histidine kinase